MNWGFGGITSGLGGGASTSDFLRFLGLAFALIAFEVGSCECESYSGGILGCRGETWTGGGEHEGREEGGEKEVMSTEGDRARCAEEEGELGVDESSGPSGVGGRTKWNVREAIWI